MQDRIPVVINTLGEHLDWQARRMAARRLPELPWARPLAVMLGHMTSLLWMDGRFLRIEGPAPGVELPGRREEARPEAPAIYRPTPQQGRTLPLDVQARLREVVGPGVERLRVHDNETADTTARAHRADAVTIGQDVFFRQGRFQPREPRGFRLLAHEATHLVQLLRPGAAWRRATGAGVRDDEAEALNRERELIPPPGPGVPMRQAWSGIGPAPGHRGLDRQPAVRPPVASTAQSPATLPMTAETKREVGQAAPAPLPLDLEQLRRTLVRDIMHRLRSEFERGG